MTATGKYLYALDGEIKLKAMLQNGKVEALTDNDSPGCFADVPSSIDGCVNHRVILDKGSIHFVSLLNHAKQSYVNSSRRRVAKRSLTNR